MGRHHTPRGGYRRQAHTVAVPGSVIYSRCRIHDDIGEHARMLIELEDLREDYRLTQDAPICDAQLVFEVDDSWYSLVREA